MMDGKSSAHVNVFSQPGKITITKPSKWDLVKPVKQIAKRILIKDNTTILERIAIFVSEFCGTAVLVFLGCTGCINFGTEHSELHISLSFGLGVMVAVQCFGHISGSHLNPLVTIAATIMGKTPLVQIPIYFCAQMVGAIAGFGLILLATPSDVLNKNPGLCSPGVTKGFTQWQGFLVEFLISLILTLVCCGVWDARNNTKHDSVPIRFGFTITVLALAGISYTGANMNPARSFAPALLNNQWDDHWIYWVAPLCAGFLGALFYRLVLEKEEENTTSFEVSKCSEVIPQENCASNNYTINI